MTGNHLATGSQSKSVGCSNSLIFILKSTVITAIAKVSRATMLSFLCWIQIYCYRVSIFMNYLYCLMAVSKNLVDALANDSAQLEQHKRHEVPHHGEDLKQLNWLKEGLKTSTAKWKIVYGHHVLWSIGGTKYAEAHVLKKLLLPSLCQYADAYIAGHEHDLELLTDDCSVATPQITRPKLPLIISGAAAKMRGKHTPFAEQQAKRYPQYELLWSKSFTWGFAHTHVLCVDTGRSSETAKAHRG
eukprot:TRINITY_DN331_c0_g1_i3.p1 TRINITY_DN331_c0_g1~~TRINITY_DN331_c0_g1_i3.p1  ORF type:complete len:244 (-),score=79.92 TRINITY_DN331_c0_g1_i3:4-735(-)